MKKPTAFDRSLQRLTEQAIEESLAEIGRALAPLSGRGAKDEARHRIRQRRDDCGRRDRGARTPEHSAHPRDTEVNSLSDIMGRLAFLEAAASHFEHLPTGGEDRGHWANVYNAKNCREIAVLITNLRDLLECALDEYEGTNGSVIVGEHWSRKARSILEAKP
jgi:hypothetical protein